jgi:hypothetical protein
MPAPPMRETTSETPPLPAPTRLVQNFRSGHHHATQGALQAYVLDVDLHLAPLGDPPVQHPMLQRPRPPRPACREESRRRRRQARGRPFGIHLNALPSLASPRDMGERARTTAPKARSRRSCAQRAQMSRAPPAPPARRQRGTAAEPRLAEPVGRSARTASCPANRPRQRSPGPPPRHAAPPEAPRMGADTHRVHSSRHLQRSGPPPPRRGQGQPEGRSGWRCD